MASDTPSPQTKTEKAVFDACEALVDQGVWPTQREVQRLTQSSFSTIGPPMKRWQTGFLARRTSEARYGDTPEEVVKLAEKAYAAAIRAAESRLTETLERETAKLEAQRGRMFRVLSKARQARHTALVARDKALDDLASFRESEAALSRTLKATEGQLSELRAQNSALESTLAETRNLVEHLNTERSQAARAVDALEATLAREYQRAGELIEGMNKAMTEKSSEYTRERDALLGRIDEERGRADAAQERADAAESGRRRIESDYRALNTALAESQTRIATLEANLSESRQREADLKSKADGIERAIDGFAQWLSVQPLTPAKKALGERHPLLATALLIYNQMREAGGAQKPTSKKSGPATK